MKVYMRSDFSTDNNKIELYPASSRFITLLLVSLQAALKKTVTIG